MKEITAETERKLKVFAFSLFEDMQGQHDYPHKTWERQYAECCEQYKQGGISESFLDFAVE